MSSLLIALVAMAVPPCETEANAPTAPSAQLEENPKPAPLVGRELDRAVHETLRRWAHPSEAEADQAAREFLSLFTALSSDTRLAPGTREQLRNKVRGRLVQLSDQIARRVAQENREAKPPKKLETPDGKGENLAQLAGPQFGRPAGAGLAGPGVGRPGGPQDNGQALVDLIQKTIAPSTWAASGGPGSIYYWQPQRALIVRQTGEVHEQLGDVLRQLERAGQ